MFTLTLSSYFGSPLIAHQCCDQLTAVKTRYPLTSITWPYLSRSSILLKLSADKLLVFKWSQAHFLKFIWNMLCLCHYGPALLTFWFQTDLGRDNSASYLKVQAGKTDAFHFSHHSHALVTLHVQFLCYDWSKFDRWVHGENLCSILRLVYFDRVLCQLVMFLTVFFHWMYKMKYSCHQESSVIHGWFVYCIFGWEMRNLSKSDGIVFVFHLAGCVREL